MRVFDIESDGLLDEITKVQCINGIDRETGEELRFTDHEYYQDLQGNYTDVKTPRTGTIADGLVWLEEAEVRAGHHIIGYDDPAIKAVYPHYSPKGAVYDSKVASEFLYPDLTNMDFASVRKGRFSQDAFKNGGKFYPMGSHSLYPWGIRLGGQAKSEFDPKDYGHTWKTMPFTQEFDEYCMQDVRANVALIEHFESREHSREALELEFRVAEIIRLQERVGVKFDYEAAEKLASTLYVRQRELVEECRAVFPPFFMRDGKEFTPKQDNKRYGYAAGAPLTKLKLVEFNPSSSAHIVRCLRHKYDWEPIEFTDKGNPKMDEDVLSGLPFAEVPVISEYLMVRKRLSQLAEGKQAWMKQVKSDGRIYGKVNQLGTATGRMSHSGPNLAQVPKCGSPYGEECRRLFVADTGRVIVGCDADALELRVLAHFMARFDRGEYVKTVLEGKKEDGTDMHTRNMQAAGLGERDTAKTFFYALLYGSGNPNLGNIVTSEWPEEKLMRFYAKFPPGKPRMRRLGALGRSRKENLTRGLPALGKLLDKVTDRAKRGFLVGIDGRRIGIRSAHSALNFLCQSAGAIVMKQALVIMFDQFREEGLDVLPLLNVHDEVQLSCRPEEAERVGQIAADSIRLAGEHFNFRCPLAGDYDIGLNWAETH